MPTDLLPAPEPHHGAVLAGNGHFSRGLDFALTLLLASVQNPHTKRCYARSLMEFSVWRDACQGGFDLISVSRWRDEMKAKGLRATSVNQKLAAIRKLAKIAAAQGLIDPGQAAGIVNVDGVKQRGSLTGNWLSQAETQRLIESPQPNTLKGKRDRCALAILVGCALRRSEAAGLVIEQIQQREGRWVIADLRGKGGRIRTAPMPAWTKAAVDRWAEAAGIAAGRILRAMNRHGRITHNSLSGQAVLDIAAKYGAEIGVRLRAHDLRRTSAKLCRKHGGELEQIQLLLGHASIQTTETYLGTKQDLANAPNDHMGLGWRDE